MKYFTLLFLAIVCCSCSVVSRQTYYVPSAAHRTVKDRSGYFKMVHSEMKISGAPGDSIGRLITSNGIGNPVLAGPPFLPVIPVGLIDIFYKRNHLFILDLEVRSNNGYFMRLAIDSNEYKKKTDSLDKLKIRTAAALNTSQCYMIVNGSTRVPLHTEEFLMGHASSHSYRLSADFRFKNVKTMQLVTGNALLDSTLKNVTFTRKHRITYCVMGPS
jgi:hypothetical protein